MHMGGALSSLGGWVPSWDSAWEPSGAALRKVIAHMDATGMRYATVAAHGCSYARPCCLVLLHACPTPGLAWHPPLPPKSPVFGKRGLAAAHTHAQTPCHASPCCLLCLIIRKRAQRPRVPTTPTAGAKQGPWPLSGLPRNTLAFLGTMAAHGLASRHAHLGSMARIASTLLGLNVFAWPSCLCGDEPRPLPKNPKHHPLYRCSLQLQNTSESR